MKLTRPSRSMLSTRGGRQPARTRREEFQTQLKPHLDGLYRTAVRLTRNPTDAEDVLQEAVLRAYRSFGTFRTGTNFRAWIHRVLYTVFLNTTRHRGPRISPLETMPEPQESESQFQAELGRPTHRARQEAVLEAVDERIKEAVMTLPQDLRLVFMLNTIEGLKYREIAEVMGCPLGTVMSRLSRSRKMLQEHLVDYAREAGLSRGAASLGVARAGLACA